MGDAKQTYHGYYTAGVQLPMIYPQEEIRFARHDPYNGSFHK